jgi:hypothetical protein
VPPLFGGGGSTPSAPTTTGFPVPGQANIYQPQFQPQADYNAYNILSDQPYSLLGQYQSGNTPVQQLYYGQAAPEATAGFNLVNGPQSFAGQIPGNVSNNPYYNQAQTGANVYANLISGQYGGGQGEIANFLNQALDVAQPGVLQAIQSVLQGGQTLGGLSQQVSGLIDPTTKLAQQATANIPAVNQLAQGVAGNIPDVQGLAGQVAGTLPQYQKLADLVGGLQAPVSAQADTLGGIQANLQGISGAAGLPGDISNLNQGAQQLLQTGMDPQQALYNRTAQRVLDQQRAVNALSGVGTSPYGAGVTGQAMENFNIDWQNQQLARQQAALQGAGTAYGQVGNLAGLQGGLQTQAAGVGQQILGARQLQEQLAQGQGGLLTALGGQAGQAGNLYGQAGNLAQQAGGLYGQAGNLANIGSNIYGQAGQLGQQAGGLTGQQIGANQAAAGLYGQLPGLSNQFTQAYGGLGQEIARSAAAPGQTYLNQQQMTQNALTAYLNQLGGAQGLTTGAGQFGQSQYQLPENIDTLFQNYLRTGQGASQAADQLGQLGTSQATQGLAGLIGAGQLGSNLLTGQNLFGGSNSLLGGSGGLLGLLTGGGGATPADAFLSSGATSGGAADAFLTSGLSGGGAAAAGGASLADFLPFLFA